MSVGVRVCPLYGGEIVALIFSNSDRSENVLLFEKSPLFSEFSCLYRSKHCWEASTASDCNVYAVECQYFLANSHTIATSTSALVTTETEYTGYLHNDISNSDCMPSALAWLPCGVMNIGQAALAGNTCS